MAGGRGTIVSNDFEIGLGKYPVSRKKTEFPDSYTTFAVGSGTSTSRKNSLEIRSDDTVWIQGLEADIKSEILSLKENGGGSGGTSTGSVEIETTLSAASTNSKAAGAKAVWDGLGTKADLGHTHSYSDLKDLPDLSGLGGNLDTSGFATTEQIGSLENLATEHKSTIVGAINEVLGKTGDTGGTGTVGLRTALTPMFEKQGAVFNNSTGLYELNGITDIDENEIMDIWYASCAGWGWGERLFDGKICRTFFRRPEVGGDSTVAMNTSYWFSGCPNLKVVDLRCVGRDNSFINSNTASGMFIGSGELEEVLGVLNINYVNGGYMNQPFLNCYKLREIRISQTKISLNFAQSYQLSLELVLYVVKNAGLWSITSPITITLHADVYALAILDTTIIAALEDTDGKVLLASA